MVPGAPAAVPPPPLLEPAVEALVTAVAADDEEDIGEKGRETRVEQKRVVKFDFSLLVSLSVCGGVCV